MSEDEQYGRGDDLLARALELPPGGERDQLLGQLPDDEQAQARRIVKAADLVWDDAHGAPPLDQDPVAAMLGLVPDPSYQVNPAALKKARTRARLKPTELSAALSKRGWPVTTGDVFKWEQTGTASIAPALVRAVAEELHTDADALTGTHFGKAENAGSFQSIAGNVADQVTRSPAFQDLVRRFAKAQRMPSRMASSTLHAQMLATVHRGEHPTPEQMLASLQAFVEVLEADTSGPGK